MKNIKKSKKGAISSILLDFWAYVAFVLIIIIFYALFTIQAKSVKENKITGIAYDLQPETILLNYLRTPVATFSDGMQDNAVFADVITNYYLLQDTITGNNLQNILLTKTREIFNEQYRDEWIMAIEDSEQNIVFSFDSDSMLKNNLVSTETEVRVVTEAAFAYLPLNPSNDIAYLKIKLLIRVPKEGVVIRG
jgi:hypothetical protein